MCTCRGSQGSLNGSSPRQAFPSPQGQVASSPTLPFSVPAEASSAIQTTPQQIRGRRIRSGKVSSPIADSSPGQHSGSNLPHADAQECTGTSARTHRLEIPPPMPSPFSQPSVQDRVKPTRPPSLKKASPPKRIRSDPLLATTQSAKATPSLPSAWCLRGAMSGGATAHDNSGITPSPPAPTGLRDLAYSQGLAVPAALPVQPPRPAGGNAVPGSLPSLLPSDPCLMHPILAALDVEDGARRQSFGAESCTDPGANPPPYGPTHGIAPVIPHRALPHDMAQSRFRGALPRSAHVDAMMAQAGSPPSMPTFADGSATPHVPSQAPGISPTHRAMPWDLGGLSSLAAPGTAVQKVLSAADCTGLVPFDTTSLGQRAEGAVGRTRSTPTALQTSHWQAVQPNANLLHEVILVSMWCMRLVLLALHRRSGHSTVTRLGRTERLPDCVLIAL